MGYNSTRIGKSALRIGNHEVNVVEDSEDDCDIDEWIYPTTREGLDNWRAKDFIPISFNED